MDHSRKSFLRSVPVRNTPTSSSEPITASRSPFLHTPQPWRVFPGGIQAIHNASNVRSHLAMAELDWLGSTDPSRCCPLLACGLDIQVDSPNAAVFCLVLSPSSTIQSFWDYRSFLQLASSFFCHRLAASFSLTGLALLRPSGHHHISRGGLSHHHHSTLSSSLSNCPLRRPSRLVHSLKARSFCLHFPLPTRLVHYLP